MKPTYVTAYNNALQTLTADATDLLILGAVAGQCGCVQAVSNGFKVQKSGIYRISYDVTFTPTEAGAFVLQMYNNGVKLPCAVFTDTTEASNIVTGHIETIVPITSCYAIQPLIKVQASGVAGDINHICANIQRIGDCC